MPSTDDGDDRVVPDERTTDVVGARIGAQVIDTVLLFVQVVVVTLLLVLLVQPESRDAVDGLAALTVLTLPLYGGLFEGLWNGQTPGKRFTGIKVVDRQGREPGLGKALGRNVPAIVLFSWVTTAVALAAIATSDLRQRLFDGVAGTYVVDASSATDVDPDGMTRRGRPRR
jgi:uncharacterized RDD family membrane protein YckC